MKSKLIATLLLLTVIAIGTLVIADDAKPPADPRIDKILDQNAQILKNQQDMQKTLDDIKEGILQVRRRTS